MSSQKPDISCAYCHSYLFEDDDVVYCPECGAPHHRECYNQIGHCGLENFHGTENQYDKLKRKQEEKPKTEKQPKNEPTPVNSPFGNTVYIDFLGGVPKDYKLDKDVTADEAKNFVFSNTMRYIPKFARLSKKNKASWNFMAFIFPSGWLFSRKMYKSGIIVAIFEIISSLLELPFSFAVQQSGFTTFDMQSVNEIVANISPEIIACAMIGFWFNIIIRLICAILGDYWYKKHTITTIRQIKNSNNDIEYDFRKKGGVNFILFVTAVMSIEYLPIIIYNFIV